MNRYQLLVAVVGATFVAACASADKQTTAQDEDKSYVTGSRIPVHGTGARDVKGTTSRQGIDDLLHKGGNATGGVGGAGGS